MNCRFATNVLCALGIVALFSSTASAQSTISGVVRDASGAVMAGVKVDAASEALIEGSRTATTNGEGRYAIVDVRPGRYTVSFTVPGFSQLQQQVDVPANVSVPVDANLKLGAVGETVNVEALVATVDIDNVAHPEVLSRLDMDAIPSARNMQSLGSYVPGVHLNTPDVGGSMQVQQTYMTTHGMLSKNDTFLLDGMLINTTQTDGQIQTYIDNAIVQETTYQTSNVTAEVQAGGVYTNMIPKDGGNQFHSDIFLSWVPSSFVGSNIDQKLIARGVTGQSAVNQIQDFDGSLGGPIKRNKLWFLITGRKQLTNLQSPGSFNADGSPGIEYDKIYTGTARLTWQANAKNKFSAMWTRDFKYIDDDIVSGSAGVNETDPRIASDYRKPVMYYILQARWTGALTPRLLLQAGFSLDKLDYDVLNQPGILKTPFTPEWYAGASHLDTALNQRSNAGPTNVYYKFDRYVYNASATYVTGSHQIKFGIQDSSGISQANNLLNGDLVQRYTNGVPLDLQVYDTPTISKPRLNADVGIYAMDTWHIKRLAITAGLRWEYLSDQLDPESAPAGRFVPARNFAKVDCHTVKGLGCFKDWAPRLGLIYDLFGNHKTALKVGFGKYNIPVVDSILANFNPMFYTFESVPWVNPNGPVVSGAGFGLGNVGANPNPAFGVLQNRALDPNFHREYTLQYSAGIQQEVRRGVTANFNWYRTADYQQILAWNNAVPASAWTPAQITNPLDGTPITVYNLQPAYFGLTPQLYQTNSRQSTRSNTYTGFETSVMGRLPRGAFVFAGWTIERWVDKACDQNANSLNLNDPNSLRFCDWSGGSNQDLGKMSGVPFRNEFKLTANVPLKWGIEASTSLYSNPVYSLNFTNNIGTTYSPLAVFDGQSAGFKTVNWNVGPTTRYPADCNCPNPGGLVDAGLKQGTEVIPLVAPGSRLTPRLNQFDVGLRRVFHLREKFTIFAEGQIFNIANANTVLVESETLGTKVAPYLANGIGGQPTVIANPRMLRLSMQFKF
jgi:hypothetical protein